MQPSLSFYSVSVWFLQKKKLTLIWIWNTIPYYFNYFFMNETSDKSIRHSHPGNKIFSLYLISFLFVDCIVQILMCLLTEIILKIEKGINTILMYV